MEKNTQEQKEKSRKSTKWVMGIWVKMQNSYCILIFLHFSWVPIMKFKHFYPFCLFLLVFKCVRDLYALFILFEYSPWVYCSIAPTQTFFLGRALSSASLSELSFFITYWESEWENSRMSLLIWYHSVYLGQTVLIHGVWKVSSFPHYCLQSAFREKGHSRSWRFLTANMKLSKNMPFIAV